MNRKALRFTINRKNHPCEEKRTMKFTKSLGVVAAASAIALLAGCAGGGSVSPQASAGGETIDTIRVSYDTPSTNDPALGMSIYDFVLARHSFDTLVRKDQGGFIPGLATEWESTPNSATFTLRSGATCSDGTEITPTIVKNSLDRFAASEGSTVPSVFGLQIPNVSADDAAGTVAIELEQPWPDLVNGLSMSPAGIVCPAGLEDLEALAAGTAEGAESGPYVMTQAEPGVQYKYELREDYDAWPEWSDVEGRPAEKLDFVVSTDTTATANLVLDGQLDVAKITPDSTDRFAGHEDYEIATFLFSDFYVMFNEREGSPFTDPAVRKAVAQAINLEDLRGIAYGDYGKVANSFASPGAVCYNESSATIPEDMDAASKVLNGVNIRMVAPQVFGTNGSGNVYIQERLRAAGANVELANVDVGSWISTVFSEPGAWDMTVYADLNFSGSLASPLGQFVGPEPADGGGNLGATAAPAVAEAFDAARLAGSETEYCALLQEAERELISEAHGLPAVISEFLYVQRPGFAVTMPEGTLDEHTFRILD